ncbi:MAG: DEAD/DEAH box helicase, partial [bacterium]
MALSLEGLRAHGFSERVVSLLRERFTNELLPVQEEALARHGFLQGRSLIVFAPTSSGKTFIAELAALKHLEANSRVIYLVPTKALAEEKFREFTSRYAPLGYRVFCATRERPETDAAVWERRFDLLIAVYEKLRAYLVVQPEILSRVSLVVADELQMMGESDRGDVVDLLLTKVIRSPYQIQFLGLSAVLGGASTLASWLKCDLLVHKSRPVELREGVVDLFSGKYRYRSFNSGEEGTERLMGVGERSSVGDEDFGREGLFALAEAVAGEHGEQTLLFVPTRHTTRQWARLLAERVNIPPAEEALEELKSFEETHLRDLLMESLRHGVAFHNSDLSWDLRTLIEEHYNRGAIRILVSTSTLGQGVNLSGRNVIQVPQMVVTGEWTGHPTFAPLSRQRFRNQGGRAARFAKEKVDFGRSILPARNEAEAERLFVEFVEGELETLRPPLAGKSLEPYVVDLVSSHVCDSKEELEEFMQRTFTGRTYWSSLPTQMEESLEKATQDAYHKSLLLIGTGGAILPTGIGQTMATNGILPETTRQFAHWLPEANPLRVQPLEALLVAAFSPDGRAFPIYFFAGEAQKGNYVQRAREAMGERDALKPALKALLYPEGGFTNDDLIALKKALLLVRWIGAEDTRVLEEDYGLFAGTLGNLGGHFQWLVQTQLALALALGLSHELLKQLEQLGERLLFGVPPTALPLTRLRVEGLSRGYLQALLKEGYEKPQNLVGVSADRLTKVLPQWVAQSLVETIERLEKTELALSAASEEDAKAGSADLW